MPYSIDASDRRVFLKISIILTYFFFFFFPIHSSPCLSSSVVIFWFGIFIFWFLSSLFVPTWSLVYYYSWLLFLRFPAVPFSFSLSLSLSAVVSCQLWTKWSKRISGKCSQHGSSLVVGHTPTYRRRRGGAGAIDFSTCQRKRKKRKRR
jgi:hypothetical protein